MQDICISFLFSLPQKTKICYNIAGDNMLEKLMEKYPENGENASAAEVIEMLDKDSSSNYVTEDENIDMLFRPIENDPLTTSLSESTHLSEAKKSEMLGMARYYISDLKHNIMKDQFDLNTAYPDYTVDQWNSFLLDRIVNTYISKHKKTVLKMRAEATLADPTSKNKRDSLQLLNNMETGEKASDNIVIMRVPDKYA